MDKRIKHKLRVNAIRAIELRQKRESETCNLESMNMLKIIP